MKIESKKGVVARIGSQENFPRDYSKLKTRGSFESSFTLFDLLGDLSVFCLPLDQHYQTLQKDGLTGLLSVEHILH